MSRLWSKSLCSKRGWVTFSANFRGKGTSPTNDYWHQKTRVPGLSYSEKSAEIFNRLSRAHYRHRQTDRRQTTDGSAIAYSERNVKLTFAKIRVVDCRKVALLRVTKLMTCNICVQDKNVKVCQKLCTLIQTC